jgi:hypothetical protein
MVERIDRRTRADRPKSSNRRTGDEATLVHAKIFAHDDVGTNLRVLVEEQRSANRRLDDPGTGIEPYGAVKKCRLTAGILEEVNRDIGKFHVRVCVGAIEELRPKSAAFPLDGKEKGKYQAAKGAATSMEELPKRSSIRDATVD